MDRLDPFELASLLACAMEEDRMLLGREGEKERKNSSCCNYYLRFSQLASVVCWAKNEKYDDEKISIDLHALIMMRW